VKKRALFVLSQFGTKESLDIVVDAARASNDPELREEAIRMLGVSGEKAAVERLRELYAQSKDPREQKAIIQAWLVADRQDLVLGAAQSAGSEEVRRAAIQTLGAMGAGAELKKMFDQSKDPETQREIIRSLGVAGDTAAIAAIAESGASEEVREEALRSLGVAGDTEALVRMYAKSNSQKLREAALQGLLITGDSKAVLGLYRVAKTKEEKQAILRTLTVMDGDAAVDLIEAELGGK
jgi:HEAT repeat protein